jgi:leucyl aminopeptidase
MISFSVVREVPDDADAEAVGVVAGGEADAVDAATAGFLASVGFEGKAGETAFVRTDDDRPLVIVGLGPADEVDGTALRTAGAAVARATSRQRKVAVRLAGAANGMATPAVAAQALAEGFLLGGYRFTRYREDKKPAVTDEVAVVLKGGAPVRAALDRAAVVADAVRLARDLVNEPGGRLTPRVFADAAKEVAERDGIAVTVLDEKAIKKEKLGGVLGVNRGSTEPPRLVRLDYTPTGRPRGRIAFVGKGITFDSGGLSLKTAEGMMEMKSDMGGGAAVLGAISAAAQLEAKVALTGFIPLTDNMPGPDATRVGDVLNIRNGKTVEVLNTDAEGRLILADGLSLASEEEPDAIVDVATLTGACMVALGRRVAGLMGNDDGWIEQVQAAADRAGEPCWPLPLPALYRKDLDSTVADLKNISGGRYGGALYAGLFLQEFVGEGIPWAHLDIAGPSWAEADDGELTPGGTGFGVRTLVELATGFRKP